MRAKEEGNKFKSVPSPFLHLSLISLFIPGLLAHAASAGTGS